MKKPLIIAFYLPQFHPFPENDEWWGKGFTEWTNVGKAKPLFKGHNQPRVPTELGYYDLRLPIVREQQAQMAKDAGVTAFCYWHYWFGNGKRLIPEVFDEVLSSGKPDFPFCLGWANHSWMAKDWNSDGTTRERMLMEQTYPGLNDAKMHFEFLLKAFKDNRYLKVDNKPLLYIFRPKELPLIYVQMFKQWTKEAGFKDLLLIGQLNNAVEKEIQIQKNELIKNGYDYVTIQRIGKNAILEKQFKGQVRLTKLLKEISSLLFKTPPFLQDYSKTYKYMVREIDRNPDVIPSILPQWDHSPRSGFNGVILKNCTPDVFYKHTKEVFAIVKEKEPNSRIVFLKSWNEWGEGNMMEPDLTYGRGFIEALRKAVDEY